MCCSFTIHTYYPPNPFQVEIITLKKLKNITMLTLSFNKFKTYVTIAICRLTAVK